MKLLLVTAALCVASLQANAQTVYGVGAGYEYDAAVSNPGGLKSVSKSSVLVGARNKYGQFDGGLYEVAVHGNGFYDTQQGVEVGYGNDIQAGLVNLSGRAAYGKVYGRGLGSPKETGTYSTYAISAGIPITKQLGVGVTVRYRPEHDFDTQKQYSVGANYFINKNVQVLGAFRHTRSTTSPVLNGVYTQIRYYF